MIPYDGNMHFILSSHGNITDSDGIFYYHFVEIDSTLHMFTFSVMRIVDLMFEPMCFKFNRACNFMALHPMTYDHLSQEHLNPVRVIVIQKLISRLVQRFMNMFCCKIYKQR